MESISNLHLIEKLSMRILLLLFFFSCMGYTWSQDSTILIVKCVDVETKSVIHHAKVLLNSGDGANKSFTNKDGEARFYMKPMGKKIKLTVSHGYYNQLFKVISVKDLKVVNGQSFITIALKRDKTLNLGSVNVSAPGIPRIAYQSKTHSVSDFEFLPNGELLLLLYPKSLKKGSSLGILSGGDIVSRFDMPEKPIELIHDFRGNAHVVCAKGVYGIHREKDKVGISTHQRDYFMRYVFPIVDTNYTKYYFSNFNKNYPAFDYLIYDELDSSYQKIIEIKDELMMELYRSEYKWVDVRTQLWAKTQELQTGIDKEIWVGSNYFTQSIYYKELYAPMFYKNDSIYIFDYYRDHLFTFNQEGEKIDSVAIYHHYQGKKNGWKRLLVQDRDNGAIYAYYEKAGICSLRKVDTKTGLLGSSIEFKHKYIDQISVHAGQAYYIYRPFESAQKKFLYQTALPDE